MIRIDPDLLLEDSSDILHDLDYEYESDGLTAPYTQELLSAYLYKEGSIKFYKKSDKERSCYRRQGFLRFNRLSQLEKEEMYTRFTNRDSVSS